MHPDKAQQKAYNFDQELQSTDPRFRRSVIVFHEEGTTLIFIYAFLLEDEEYYYIFTEHHRFHVYSKDEIRDIIQFSDRIWNTEQFQE